MHDVLGHERCAVVARRHRRRGRVDLVHRFAGFVDRLCFFNTVPPARHARGSTVDVQRHPRRADGRLPQLQGARPDELAAMLPTDAARRQWIAAMYTSRLWASPGTFTPAEVDFMTEPFADERTCARRWSPYQLAHGRPMSETPMTRGPIDTPTLVLYGHDDHVVGDDFVPACEAAFTNRIGPLRHPGRRPLPAVGAGRHLQPAAHRDLRRPDRRTVSTRTELLRRSEGRSKSIREGEEQP